MKDYKERFDEIFANRKVIGDRTFKDYHEYLYTDILDFIEQIISERDKELLERIKNEVPCCGWCPEIEKLILNIK